MLVVILANRDMLLIPKSEQSKNWFINDGCNLQLHGIRTEEKYQMAIAVHVKSLNIEVESYLEVESHVTLNIVGVHRY
ncbi:hypothetical protein H5410_041464 [Solanum commersonii]|uniref:Uncharacterized protein n=1 Tax=Solanum commersonii TaxID=4109 RepID=A0A9J5XVL4_SOLCO|nr:hypothetical protein H5410_041464 [Solanum commersonii]